MAAVSPLKTRWPALSLFLCFFLFSALFIVKWVFEPPLYAYRDIAFGSKRTADPPHSPPGTPRPLFLQTPVLLDGNISLCHYPPSPPETLPPLSLQTPVLLGGNISLRHTDKAPVEHEHGDVYIGENEPSSSEKIIWDKSCDLYTGRWVKDNGYPLYQPESCPYVDEAFSCQENGRPDGNYMKWRWKPDGCDIPRFNATDFLERLRGKRLMLVGDSMNRNQFESILCLLREGLLNKSRMFEVRGNKITKGRGYFIFRFMDYNCTVGFVRSHFLVKEGTRLNSEGKTRPTLAIDRIDKSFGRWKKADILIFNTGHWWTHGKTARGKDYYIEGGNLYPQFDAVEAYRRAIRTWGRWIKANMDPKKKLVFYRGYSTAHFRGGDWDSGGTCNGEKEPIANGPFLDNYPEKMRIVEEVIRELKVPAILLNVTRLTNYRKDGHPSIYRKVVAEGHQRSTRRQDCSHWCLPGVPDAWNELIYASLVMGKTSAWS